MKYLIVGGGVAGVTAAQTVVRADSSAQVSLLAGERYPYYRRPRLWEFIAAEIEQDALYFRPTEWYTTHGIELHLGVRVVALDTAAHRLELDDGTAVQYERLLLATGARPFVPPCEGTDKIGVFTLRTLDDALAIKRHVAAHPSSEAVVIGGGLLGLETARALHGAGLGVTVVEFSDHLLPRQLDTEGAAVLRDLLEAQGLHILTNGHPPRGRARGWRRTGALFHRRAQ